MLGLDIRENAYKLNTGGTRYCQTLSLRTFRLLININTSREELDNYFRIGLILIQS